MRNHVIYGHKTGGTGLCNRRSECDVGVPVSEPTITVEPRYKSRPSRANVEDQALSLSGRGISGHIPVDGQMDRRVVN
jgi:hypothetical protein